MKIARKESKEGKECINLSRRKSAFSTKNDFFIFVLEKRECDDGSLDFDLDQYRYRWPG